MIKHNSPKGFCILPWQSLYIQNDGSQNICCYYQREEFTGIHSSQLLDENDPLSAEELKKIRGQMLNNEWAEGCSSCKKFESNGGMSHRQRVNKHSENKIKEILNLSKTKAIDSTNISHMELRIGNLCNLRCRMCDVESTQKWIDDWNELHPKQLALSNSTLQAAKDPAWCEVSEYWDLIHKHSKNLKMLEFAGGEPFLSQKLLEFLNFLIDNDLSTKISLSFITNLTHLPTRFLETFSEFKDVSITVSLDATEQLNDYIRTGSQFKIIHQNLQILDRDFKILNLNRVSINTTLQAYNAYAIKDVVHYLDQFKFVTSLPFLSPLSSPNYFAIEVLPKTVKNKVKNEITKILEQYNKRNVTENLWLLKSFEQALSLLALPTDNNLLKILKQETLKLDQFDKVSLKNVAPKLYLELFL